MAIFKYDVLLNEEDLCDRKKEMERVLSIVRRHGRLVIYSIRRMGKSSLVTVCSQKFRDEHPKAFHLFVDLNEVQSLADVASRFRSHYEFALKEQLPFQAVKAHLQELLSRMKVSLPGDVELSLEQCATQHPESYLLSLFSELKRLSTDRPLSVMIDEFQGIAKLSDAQALLRREFQKLSEAAVVLMGSNQRLLYEMFNDQRLPFFGFGEDLELGPIPLQDYLPYLNERFDVKGISISREIAVYLLEHMNNVPNYINELGAWIVETMSNVDLTKGHIDEAVESAARSKRGRYVSALYGYTFNQKRFLRAVAKHGRVKAFSGKEMQILTDFSASELVRVKEDLEDCPLLTRDTENRLLVVDPFLRKFLEMI